MIYNKQNERQRSQRRTCVIRCLPWWLKKDKTTSRVPKHKLINHFVVVAFFLFYILGKKNSNWWRIFCTSYRHYKTVLRSGNPKTFLIYCFYNLPLKSHCQLLLSYWNQVLVFCDHLQRMIFAIPFMEVRAGCGGIGPSARATSCPGTPRGHGGVPFSEHPYTIYTLINHQKTSGPPSLTSS